MPASTRSASRLSGSQPNSSPAPASSPDLKRKAGSSPAVTPSKAKKGRKDPPQKKLEEVMPDQGKGQPDSNVTDSELKQAGEKIEGENDDAAKSNGHAAESNGKNGNSKAEDKPQTEEKTEPKPKQEGAIQSSQGRAEKMPSNILEKGVIYFFARGRVGVDEPADVKDIARSYIVLRPLPKDAKLTDGALEDLKNNRLLAVPKKVLPKSHHDAFMVFVEKAKTSLQDLRDNFMTGSEYSTKTTGVSQTPPVTPIAEGVYAITTQGRDSHLAYMTTIPEKIGQVQESMGLKDKGSFVLSAKNPEQKGPANATLPEGPGFPPEILEAFQGRRWMGLQPHHLDYPNAQCLFIGEGAGEFRRAGEKTQRDEQESKESPEEEIENLEGEDAHRAKVLDGDDTIFDDLGISHKEYPKVKTTW